MLKRKLSDVRRRSTVCPNWKRRLRRRSVIAIASCASNGKSSMTTVARYSQNLTEWSALTPTNMSRMEENQERTKSSSTSTAVASLAALGSAVLASSCCLPLLPFLFAAGAAGTSAFVVQLRPYLLVLSVLLIAFGFYKSWRAKQCNCKPSRISTFLLWFSAIAVFIFIFFPQVIANLVADLLAGKS